MFTVDFWGGFSPAVKMSKCDRLSMRCVPVAGGDRNEQRRMDRDACVWKHRSGVHVGYLRNISALAHIMNNGAI